MSPEEERAPDPGTASKPGRWRCKRRAANSRADQCSYSPAFYNPVDASAWPVTSGGNSMSANYENERNTRNVWSIWPSLVDHEF